MKEYSVTFIFDYVVMLCNPVEAEDENSAFDKAKEFVAICGIDIDSANYGIEIEEIYG